MAKGINLIITVDGQPVMVANSLLLNLMCNYNYLREGKSPAPWQTRPVLPDWEVTEHFTEYAKAHIAVIIEAVEIDESVLEDDS